MQHFAPGEHPLQLREGQGPGRDHLLHSQADNEGGGLVPVENHCHCHCHCESNFNQKVMLTKK